MKQTEHPFRLRAARTWARSRDYFSECGEELRYHNWSLLQKMCWLYLLAQAVYLVIVCPLQNVPNQTIAVLAAFAVQTLYSGVVHYLAGQTVPSARAVTGLVMFFGLEIMVPAAWLGIVSFPHTPALLFPLFLIMMTQIYTLPPRCIFPLTIGSYLLFLLGSLCLKPHAVFMQDVIGVTVALIISLVSYLTLLRFKTDAFVVRKDLEQMSSLDDMTGLLNKSTLEFGAADYLRRRVPGEPFAMGVVDLDHFKEINDQYGHSMGDSVLLAFANLLQHVFPPDQDFLTGRFGGDEFVVLLKNVASPEEAEAKFQKLLEKAAERNHFEFPVSCSAGVIFFRQDELSFTQAFLSADRALYTAKANGRAQVCMGEYAAGRGELPLMLIAESLESNRAILRNCFEDSFRILEVSDGQEALNLILRYQDGISVLLLDTELEVLGSQTLLRRLHGIPRTQGIAVFLLSFQDGQNLWADDPLVRGVLPKPLQPSQVVQRVAERLSIRMNAS